MTATKPNWLKSSLAGVLAVTTMLSSGVVGAFADSSVKSNSGAKTLEDGEYYATVLQYTTMEQKYSDGNNSDWGKSAKLKVENGKYTVTLDYYDRSAGNVDYELLLVEKLKDNSYDKYLESNTSPGFALGLLPEGFDVTNSGFSRSVRRKIKSDYDVDFDKLETVKITDSHYQYTFEVDPAHPQIYINTLYRYTSNIETGKKFGTYNSYYLNIDVNNTFNIPDNILTDFDEEVSYNYDELLSKGYVSLGLKHPTARATAKDGKLYVKYYYDYDAVKSRAGEMFIGVQLMTADGKNIVLDDDGSFTLAYDSTDDILNGVSIIARLNAYRGQVIDGEYHKVPYTSDINLTYRIDLGVKPVKLTDSLTGVSVYTSTRYVSENAVMVSTDVAKDSDAYKTMMDHCENIYNNMLYKKYVIIDDGKVVTNVGSKLVMTFPVTDEMNKLGLSTFYAHYYDEYDFWGWQIYGSDSDFSYNGYRINNDTFMLITDEIDLGDYIGFFDKKNSSVSGENLEDGTYNVPITVFNETDPSATSMAAGCLGKTAKLVVKDGKKRIELGFVPVEDKDMNGYLIQMWYYDQNDEMHELKYTSYYKNEDGSYFTDDLNAGTNNYYPKTAYIELPTNDGQFITKFRVSAMDAIMGNSGDATRNGIFTVYYDQAEKISDETPDADPEEIPGFEPADTTKLKALIEKAEALKEDDYTMSTYTTMRNAIAGAKVILSNIRSTQEEVDNATTELENAINALVKKTPDINDKNNLPDGKYTLYAQMIKTDRESFSMSNNAINHNVWLEVKDGEYYLTMQFKGMSIYNKFGYLLDLAYFDKGYTYNEYGIPEGNLVPATVLTTQKDSDGNDVIDRYNDANTLYPELLKIKLVDKASEKYVPLQVFVPVMESIAEETGTQPVLMQLDWSTLKVDESGEIDPEKPVEQSPEVNFTDTATGVKVHADKGVLPEGASITVTAVTSGAAYDSAVAILGDDAKNAKLYEVKFFDKDGNAVKPNGTVSITFPSDDENTIVYRISDDSKVLVKGIFADHAYTVITKTGGIYAEVLTTAVDPEDPAKPGDSDKPATPGDSDGPLNPGTGVTVGFAAVAPALCAGAAMIAAKKRRNKKGE